MSKSLHEAEVRYLLLEKAILAVVLAHVSCPITSRHTQLLFLPIFRLKPYSECRLHRKSSQVGYNSRAFDIKYMPRTSIKGQVLADLVAEFTEPQIEELQLAGNMDEKLVGTISQYRLPTWEIYVDGASNQKGLGIGLVLMSSEKVVIEKSLRLNFLATNNEAEYETLLVGMTMVQRMGGKSIKLFSDSRLVVGQVRGEFEAKDERIQGY